MPKKHKKFKINQLGSTIQYTIILFLNENQRPDRLDLGEIMKWTAGWTCGDI